MVYDAPDDVQMLDRILILSGGLEIRVTCPVALSEPFLRKSAARALLSGFVDPAFISQLEKQ